MIANYYGEILFELATKGKCGNLTSKLLESEVIEEGWEGYDTMGEILVLQFKALKRTSKFQLSFTVLTFCTHFFAHAHVIS